MPWNRVLPDVADPFFATRRGAKTKFSGTRQGKEIKRTIRGKINRALEVRSWKRHKPGDVGTVTVKVDCPIDATLWLRKHLRVPKHTVGFGRGFNSKFACTLSNFEKFLGDYGRFDGADDVYVNITSDSADNGIDFTYKTTAVKNYSHHVCQHGVYVDPDTGNQYNFPCKKWSTVDWVPSYGELEIKFWFKKSTYSHGPGVHRRSKR